MSLASLALVFALQGQFQTDDGIILAISNDTAFVLPLSSVHRSDQTTSATLVSIYPEVGEAWEEVRRDMAVEINCSLGQWRVTEEKRIARDGTIKLSEPQVPGWKPIPSSYPPAAALKAIVCDGIDVSSGKLVDWQGRLPEIRARLR